MKDPSATLIGNRDAKVKEAMLSKNDTKNGTPGKVISEEIMESTATNSEVGLMFLLFLHLGFNNTFLVKAAVI